MRAGQPKRHPTDETALAKHPFRAIKRFALVFVAVTIALAIAWTAWHFTAHRQLQARLDAIRAKHEPLDAADFDTEPVSPSHNSVPLWKAACAAVPVGTDCPSSSNLQWPLRFPLPAAWYQLEDKAIVADAKALVLARQASEMPESDWGRGASTSGNFGPLRALANVMADAVLYAHIHGNDAEALHIVHDLLAQASAMESIGSLSGYLTAIGVRSVALERLTAILPTLKLVDFEALPNGSATTEQIHSLIDELVDERQCRISLQMTFFESRREAKDYVDGVVPKSLLGPMLGLSESRVLERYGPSVEAARQSNLPAATAVWRAVNKGAQTAGFFPGVQPLRISRWVDSDLDPSWMVNYFRAHWQGVADRRIVLTMLAIRLYRADDHNWPTTLNDLVPKYLQAVPRDPFLPGNHPIGYVNFTHALPNGGDQRMLYFGFAGDPMTARVPVGPLYGWHQEVETVEAGTSSPGPRGRVTSNGLASQKQVKILGQWRDLSQ